MLPLLLLQFAEEYSVVDENGRKAWAMDDVWARYHGDDPESDYDNLVDSGTLKQQQQQQTAQNLVAATAASVTAAAEAEAAAEAVEEAWYRYNYALGEPDAVVAPEAVNLEKAVSAAVEVAAHATQAAKAAAKAAAELVPDTAAELTTED